eukprot:4156182-Pleurochrysis_carterae.AAC.1
MDCLAGTTVPDTNGADSFPGMIGSRQCRTKRKGPERCGAWLVCDKPLCGLRVCTIAVFPQCRDHFSSALGTPA